MAFGAAIGLSTYPVYPTYSLPTYLPTNLPTYHDTDIPQRCISFIQGIDTIRQGDDFGTAIGLRIDQLGD